jgi:uncharacterized protein YlxW (UPF0749 family)
MTALTARLRAIPSWQVTLGVALFALGFLIAAQLASEGPRIRYTTQERPPLVETAIDLQAQQEALKVRILELRALISDQEGGSQGSQALVRELDEQLGSARTAAGLLPLVGTGIVIRLEDSIEPAAPGTTDADYLISSADLRTVVEELWLVGAEAMAINGERITATTAIIDIGPSILVNSAYLAPPFQVTALGPPDLYDRLAASEGYVDFVRARVASFGLRVSYAEPERVEIPAFAGTVSLRHARIAPDETSDEVTGGEPGEGG